MTQFQCDLCQFRNLKLRDPSASGEDKRLMLCIRRANLDAFWSREPKTVNKNRTEAKRAMRHAETVGLYNVFPPMGPFPLADVCGMGVAVVMLLRSRDKGKNKAHVQFDTARRVRSAYSNCYHASAAGLNSAVMAKDTRKLVVTQCATYGEWFERFALGMNKRMGDQPHQDLAISIEVMLELMELTDRDWEQADNPQEKKLASLDGCFYVIAFCGGLRGEEVVLLDLFGTQSHYEAGGRHDTPHVIINLLGKFKSEKLGRCHLLPLSAETATGLKPRVWVGRALEILKRMGHTHGPVFRLPDGSRARAGSYEERWMDRLLEIQHTKPQLIDASLDVIEEYGIYRSFRRGATTHAQNQKVPAEVVDANNRWRRFERAGTRKPKLPMRELYTEVLQLLPTLLQFSAAL